MAVTLEDAKRQIHVTDPARDAEVQMILDQAQARIANYLGSYAANTDPLLIDAGVLRILANWYEHRGDDANENHETKLMEGISELFMQSRNPALA